MEDSAQKLDIPPFIEDKVIKLKQKLANASTELSTNTTSFKLIKKRNRRIKSLKATGSPWEPKNQTAATVPVPLPVIIVSEKETLTEMDRKLWAFLLHHAWHELGEKTIHSVLVSEIAKVFREVTNSHYPSSWIWKSAERLAQTTVRWLDTWGDTRYEGISGLFSAAKPQEGGKEKGVLRYAFPPLLVPILKDPRRFARLRTHVVMRLSGKYAVTLYEILESIVNMKKPVLRVSITEIRNWLKVPEGKLTRWPDLYRRVLKPATEEINKHRDSAGFSVKMTVERERIKVNGVCFHVTKTEEREILEQGIQEQKETISRPDVEINPKTYDIAKRYAVGWDIHYLEQQWQAWGKKKRNWPPENPDGAFVNFCKRKGRHPIGRAAIRPE